jgi:hypothetical protein
MTNSEVIDNTVFVVSLSPDYKGKRIIEDFIRHDYADASEGVDV